MRKGEEMMRRLNTIGLAFSVICAMAALVTTGASAQPFHFGSDDSDHVVLSGIQHGTEDIFVATAGSARCNTVSYAGTINEVDTKATEVTLTPSFGACRAFGFINVPIDATGCAYVFTVKTFESSSYEGKFDIECTGANRIMITAPGCTATIGPQNNLEKVTYTNVGVGTTREITADLNLSNVHYFLHNEGGFTHCPSGTYTDGIYVGSNLVTGSISGQHVGLFVQTT